MTTIDEPTTHLSDDERDRFLHQLHTHQPIAGVCPQCHEKRCGPRREAQERLMADGVDLSRPSVHGDGIIQLYRAQYREHRNDPDACRRCGVPDCDLALRAWQGLIASGVNPATEA